MLELNSDWDGYSTYWVPSINNNYAAVESRSNGYIECGVIDISNTSDTNQTLLWGYPCQESYNFENSFTDFSPANDGSMVYFSCSGAVYGFDIKKGKLKKQYSCSECGGQPIITDDSVIINSNSGVQIFDKDTTKIKAQLSVSGMLALHSNYTLNDGTDVNILIVTSTSGDILAYAL